MALGPASRRSWTLGMEFMVVGWSGGGPRALACAAVLSERCRAAATLAGLAPFDAAGLDWMAGMGPGNVADFTAARHRRRTPPSRRSNHPHDVGHRGRCRGRVWASYK